MKYCAIVRRACNGKVARNCSFLTGSRNLAICELSSSQLSILLGGRLNILRVHYHFSKLNRIICAQLCIGFGYYRDDCVAVAGHEGVEEGVALDEDVGLDEVDRLDVVADDPRHCRLPDLVELLLGEGGGRDVVLVPVAVAWVAVQ